MAIQGLFYIHIQASDLARSKAFYGDALGWRLDTNLPDVAGFWFGSGYLVVSRADPPGEQGDSLTVCVRVDDLDEQHQRLLRNGVAASAIEAHPWGERNFSFRDPDGYAWLYGQSAG